MRRWAVAAALSASIIACGNGDSESAARSEPGSGAGADTGRQSPAANRPDRPATIDDTIVIEGMAEPSRATLFTTPADFALSFSTYVPEGLDVDVTPGHPGGVSFTAAFSEVLQPLAYMHVAPYEAAAGVATARDRIGGFLRSRLATGDPADIENVEDTWQRVEAPEWAVEAYSFDYPWNQDQRFVGRIILARHDDTLFHVIMHYPPEYGDGLGPRFDAILNTWRWEDTGRMLRSDGMPEVGNPE